MTTAVTIVAATTTTIAASIIATATSVTPTHQATAKRTLGTTVETTARW